MEGRWTKKIQDVANVVIGKKHTTTRDREKSNSGDPLNMLAGCLNASVGDMNGEVIKGGRGDGGNYEQHKTNHNTAAH
jgi:hypothetical protein